MRLRDLTTPLYEVHQKQPLTEATIREYGRVMPGMKGSKPPQKPRGRPGQPRMGRRPDKVFQDKVAVVKQLEQEVLDKLTSLGFKVRDASQREDFYDKIDFWITIQGTEHSVQIKQRRGGDDIIYEVYKDAYDESAPPNGRDYIGKSELYLVVDRKGGAFVIASKPLKTVIDEFLRQNGVSSGKYKGVDFKQTNDRETGQPKLMAFFPTSVYGKRIY